MVLLMEDIQNKFDFTVITPCYNAESYISETMLSVLNNSVIVSGKASLEYIIQDGGSTDKTLAIVDDITQKINNKNVAVKVYSENDTGMYDALSRALSKVNGRICSYLNAGDYYSSYSLEIVDEIFANNNIRWLTGLKVLYNEMSQIVHSTLPYKYRRALIRKGAYGKVLPFIQQESTFWHVSLNDVLDKEFLSTLKLAGDYYLWREFSKYEELNIVEAWLGGFKYHSGQMSEAKVDYMKELKMLASRLSMFDYLVCLVDIILWGAPSKIKKYCNSSHLFIYDHLNKKFF